MLLALDIGNTNIALGLYEGGRLRRHLRLATDHKMTGDEHLAAFAAALESAGALEKVGSIAIASVVPPVMPSVLDALSALFPAIQPRVLSVDDYPGLAVAYDSPAQLGIDRFVNAVAARKRYGAPVIVVDCGTATKVDAVSEEGVYLGGAIMPGIAVASGALHARASRLPRVTLVPSELRAIGRSVSESLQAGLLLGGAGAIDGVVRRIKSVVGEGAAVVATGGLSSLFTRFSSELEEHDPYLTLDGVAEIAQSRSRSRSAASKP